MVPSVSSIKTLRRSGEKTVSNTTLVAECATRHLAPPEMRVVAPFYRQGSRAFLAGSNLAFSGPGL